MQVEFPSRGQGVGRLLVGHALRISECNDERVLYIECAPTTSIPFWTAMGFVRIGATHAGKVLPLEHQLPADGERVAVHIRFFPEERLRDPQVAPISVHSPEAVRVGPDEIQLGARVFFPYWLLPARDVVVEILVGSQQLCCIKAKYEAAAAIGVRRCANHNGFELDRICHVGIGRPGLDATTPLRAQ